MLAAMIAGLTWLTFELRFLIGTDGALALIVPTVVLSDLWFCWIYAVHAIPMAFIFAGSAFIPRKARRPDRDLIDRHADWQLVQLHRLPPQRAVATDVDRLRRTCSRSAWLRGVRHRRRVVRRIFPDLGLEMGDCLRSGSEVERYFRSDRLSPGRRCSGFGPASLPCADREGAELSLPSEAVPDALPVFAADAAAAGAVAEPKTVRTPVIADPDPLYVV